MQAAPAAARPADISGTRFFDTGFEPSISADGRYVAYAGGPSDGFQNGAQVWVRDRERRFTELVSVGPGQAQADAQSLNPSISATGRYVAFESDASNLTPGDTNGATDVFVFDRTANTETLVSAGVPGPSELPAISANGRAVAFVSGPPGSRNVFVRDLDAGTTTRVSTGLGGAEPDGESFAPSISGDARTVVFTSNASNLVPGDTNGVSDVFAFDRVTGTIRRVDVTPSGDQANGAVAAPNPAVANQNGTVFAFSTFASNLLGAGPTGDIAVRDETGGTTERISTGAEVDNVYEESESVGPAMSADGRLVAYATASGQVPRYLGDSGMGVYVRDRVTSSLTRVSQLSQCRGADGVSGHPAISADGRVIAFQSDSIDLLKPGVYPGGTNPPMHVYVSSTRPSSGTEICALSVRPRTIHPRTGGSIRITLSKRGSFRIRLYRVRHHKLRRRATITGRGLGPGTVVIPFNARIHGQTLGPGTFVAVANGSARGVPWKRVTFKVRRP